MQNCGRDVANHAILYKQVIKYLVSSLIIFLPLKGCATPFTDWLLQHLHIIGMVALIFGIVEVPIIVFLQLITSIDK